MIKSTVIETSRLALRKMTDDDVVPLLGVFSDPITMQFYRKPFDRQMVQGWINWNQDNYRDYGYGLWALVLRETGELVGDCGLVNQDINGATEVEIGYHVRRDLWKQGLATEAALSCRDYGFRVLGRERLVSLIIPQNFSSRRVAEKIGMTLEREIKCRDRLTCVYAINSSS